MNSSLLVDNTCDVDVIIGKTIKHNQGYGFKITFTHNSNLDMDYYKQWITDYFRLKGFNVKKDENGYHDIK